MAMTLESIKVTQPQAPRVLLYGSHGIGKSTYGAQLPAPVFIQTEDGLGSLEVAAFPLCKNYGDVLRCVAELLTKDHGFSSVVIDSADWLDIMIKEDVLECHDKNERAYGKDTLLAVSRWRRLLGGLQDLRDKKNMIVMFLAHEEVKKFECPQVGTYDRYRPKLVEKCGDLLQEWCDVVLFCDLKTVLKEGSTRAISSGQRLCYAVETPAYLAKNRYGIKQPLEMNWKALEEKLTFKKEEKGEEE